VLARTPITVRSVDLTFTATARDWSSPASKTATWPDLVVEIVPGGPAPRDDAYLMAKIDDLLSAGVREAWVVDGDARTIEVHRRGAPVKTSTATGGVREVRSSLLGGRPLSLDSLF
jgi:Uma2 family endonuclease